MSAVRADTTDSGCVGCFMDVSAGACTTDSACDGGSGYARVAFCAFRVEGQSSWAVEHEGYRGVMGHMRFRHAFLTSKLSVRWLSPFGVPISLGGWIASSRILYSSRRFSCNPENWASDKGPLRQQKKTSSPLASVSLLALQLYHCSIGFPNV